FRMKLESAITTALNNAPAGSDPNQVVQDTLDGLLKGSDAKKAGGHHGHGGKHHKAEGSDDGQQSDFLAFLQQHGISKDQLQNDIPNAMQKAQGGNVDLSGAFRSLPPGTDVDTTV